MLPTSTQKHDILWFPIYKTAKGKTEELVVVTCNRKVHLTLSSLPPMEKTKKLSSVWPWAYRGLVHQPGGRGPGWGRISSARLATTNRGKVFLGLYSFTPSSNRYLPSISRVPCWGWKQRQKQFLFSWSVSSRIHFQKEASAYSEGKLSSHMAPLSSQHMTWTVPRSMMDSVWLFQGHPSDGKLFNKDSPAFLKYLLPDFTKFNGKYFAHRKNVPENSSI